MTMSHYEIKVNGEWSEVTRGMYRWWAGDKRVILGPPCPPYVPYHVTKARETK